MLLLGQFLLRQGCLLVSDPHAGLDQCLSSSENVPRSLGRLQQSYVTLGVEEAPDWGCWAGAGCIVCLKDRQGN